MVVSIVALVLAVAGTSMAGVATVSVLNKKEKAQTKNIAKDEIKKAAPGLSVANALDAGKLDGKDSSAFGGPTDLFSASNVGGTSLTIGASPSTLLSKSVPAGSYLVVAKVLATNYSSVPASVTCDLKTPPGAADTAIADDIPANFKKATLAMVRAVTLDSTTTLELECSTNGPLAGTATSTTLAALRVDSSN